MQMRLYLTSNGYTPSACVFPFGTTARNLYCSPIPALSTNRFAALAISFRRSSEVALLRREARRGSRPRALRKVRWESGPGVSAAGERMVSGGSAVHEGLWLAELGHCFGKVGKVDVRGQVGMARLGERVDNLVFPESLRARVRGIL